jgi:feruloyl esterase
MIDDPTKCKFDAMTELPACNAAEEAVEGINDIYSSTCFTTAQRKAIAEIYAGPHDSRGKPWYPGQTLSAEYVIKSGTGLSAALADAMGVPMFPNIALDPPEGPYFDITKIDWNRMPREMQRTTCEQCYDNGRCETFNIHDTVDGITISPSPTFNMGGLRTVYKKGAKIVQTHGWSDALVTPLAASKELYENTLQTMGVGRTKSFWKLYLVPGAGHGGGGLSSWLLNWDAFNAMVEWVEHGVEPGAINGSRAAGVDMTIDPVTNQLKYPDIRTRPNCPYPEVARFNGSTAPNAIDDAANFSCVPPIEVKIAPNVLNLNRHGILTAFITVPEGYHMRDWNLQDVMLAGAKARSGLAVGNKYIATFRTQDLQNVSAGKSIELTVTGSFNRSAKKALVQATDTVRVFEHHAQH